MNNSIFFPVVNPPLRVCKYCRGYYHTGEYAEHCKTNYWHIARRKRNGRKN